MAISIVQSIAVGQTGGQGPINFTSPVAAGNSIIVIGQGYSGSTANFSTPTYNGSVPSGTTSLIGTSSAASSALSFYTEIWLMPAVLGGGTSMALANSGGVNGFIALEAAGLGNSPSLDTNGGASQAYSTSGGSQTAMPSGFMPAIASSAALLVGSAAIYGGTGYSGPAGWVSPPQASFTISQYMIVTGAISTAYQYNPSDPGDADSNWGSLVAAIIPTYPSGLLTSSDII